MGRNGDRAGALRQLLLRLSEEHGDGLAADATSFVQACQEAAVAALHIGATGLAIECMRGAAAVAPSADLAERLIPTGGDSGCDRVDPEILSTARRCLHSVVAASAQASAEAGRNEAAALRSRVELLTRNCKDLSKRNADLEKAQRSHNKALADWQAQMAAVERFHQQGASDNQKLIRLQTQKYKESWDHCRRMLVGLAVRQKEAEAQAGRRSLLLAQRAFQAALARSAPPGARRPVRAGVAACRRFTCRARAPRQHSGRPRRH
eukprot:TRINITY_DN11251_c0_g1_i27.p2 TRINITY_DN11251_c0_g1~~TRINITY_DN11251_c0_g1_i27.p2  ORF type:complete len:264 (+),score=64.05 TRINITY_DN11251_c0_g1_i27:206-997(+)